MAELDPEAIFCEEYARSGDALAAVIAAGIEHLGDPTFRPPRAVIAQRLLERPEIKAAIEAFRKMSQIAETVEFTHRSIAGDMEAVYSAAMKAEDFSAAVRAKTLQANVLGLLEQKISITTRKRVEDMTDAELQAILERTGKLIDVTPNGTGTTTEGTDTAGRSGGDTAA